MAVSFLDAVNGVIDRGLASGIASRAGESEQAVAGGIRSASSSVLAGIVGKLGDQAGFQRIFDLISNRASSAGALDYDDATALASNFGDATSSGGAAAAGNEFATAVFDGRTAEVGNLVARASGLRGTTASSLMSLASGLVLSVLGRKVADGGLSMSALRDLFTSQKDAILRAAPAGLTQLLGVHGAQESTRATADLNESYTSYDRAEAGRRQEIPRDIHRESYADRAAREVPHEHHKRSGSRWLWPTVGALAVIAVLWSAMGRRDRRPTIDTTFAAGEVIRAVPTPGDTVTIGVVSRTLPNGKVINVASDGTESRLIGFIADPNRPVDEASWFAFDRLRFESGSAKLTSDSDQQVQDIATVMLAYPNATAKIGGFTDNVGDPRANVRLSRERANSVRDALVAKGVQPRRLVSEGYGEKMPIGDNTTEEGRAKNRRISILVTRK